MKTTIRATIATLLLSTALIASPGQSVDDAPARELVEELMTCVGWATFDAPVSITKPISNEFAGWNDQGGQASGVGFFVFIASDLEDWWTYAVNADVSDGHCNKVPPVIGYDSLPAYCDYPGLLESAHELIEDMADGSVPPEEIPARGEEIASKCSIE